MGSEQHKLESLDVFTTWQVAHGRRQHFIRKNPQHPEASWTRGIQSLWIVYCGQSCEMCVVLVSKALRESGSLQGENNIFNAYYNTEEGTKMKDLWKTQGEVETEDERNTDVPNT